MQVGEEPSPGPPTTNHCVLFHKSAQLLRHLDLVTPILLSSLFLFTSVSHCLPHHYPKLPGWTVTVEGYIYLSYVG